MIKVNEEIKYGPIVQKKLISNITRWFQFIDAAQQTKDRLVQVEGRCIRRFALGLNTIHTFKVLTKQ